MPFIWVWNEIKYTFDRNQAQCYVYRVMLHYTDAFLSRCVKNPLGSQADTLNLSWCTVGPLAYVTVMFY